MAEVLLFQGKKPEVKEPTINELQVERQYLSGQMLNLIRAKNEALARFNSDTQRLSMEMVEVVSKQNGIDEQLAKILGGV